MRLEELIARCIVRDEAAWDEFVRQYEGTVKKAVYCKLRRMGAISLMSEVDDISQEVFLGLWKGNRLSTLKGVDRIRGWLSIVAINSTLDYSGRRMNEIRKTKSLEDNFPGSDVKIEDMVASREKPFISEVEDRETQNTMLKRMRTLTDRERRLLELSIFGGLKQREIAGDEGIPENTVATIIRRGKKKLRRNPERFVNV